MAAFAAIFPPLNDDAGFAGNDEPPLAAMTGRVLRGNDKMPSFARSAPSFAAIAAVVIPRFARYVIARPAKSRAAR